MFDRLLVSNELFKAYGSCQDCGASVDSIYFSIHFSEDIGQSNALSMTWQCNSQSTRWEYGNPEIENELNYSRGKFCLENTDSNGVRRHKVEDTTEEHGLFGRLGNRFLSIFGLEGDRGGHF